MTYDGQPNRMRIPTLPEKEGYIIDYDIESGWPYYISIEEAARRKADYDEFMSRVRSRITGEPRKGKLEIISTPADVNGGNSNEFYKLWSELKNKP